MLRMNRASSFHFGFIFPVSFFQNAALLAVPGLLASPALMPIFFSKRVTTPTRIWYPFVSFFHFFFVPFSHAPSLSLSSVRRSFLLLFVRTSCVRACLRAYLGPCVGAYSLTDSHKLAPRLVGVLVPLVIVAGNTAERGGPTSESYVTAATTTTATIHTRQSVRIAQWLLGEGLVSPVALEATLRFPLVLVTPVKFSFTCILTW